MKIIEWECFEELINKGMCDITDAGPLHYPVRELIVKRDSNLQISITTTANHDAKSHAKQHPAGTVRRNDETVTIVTRGGSKVVITGVQPTNHTITTDYKSESRILTESSFAHSIDMEIQVPNKAKYLIEWLENVERSTFIWPDSIRNMVEETTKITIGNSNNEITFGESSNTETFSRKCVHLTVGEFELWLCVIPDKGSGKEASRGFLLYKGCPAEEIRKKIRNCLSFSLGRPLLYIGYTIYGEDWKLVSLKAISGYSMGGAAFNLHTMPPAPLGEKHQNYVNQKILSRLVNSLYSGYEKCNFGYVVWSYWHAVCAPLHIAAVHFGASIEALQDAYIENTGKTFKTSLIDKVEWTRLRTSALDIVSSLNIKDAEKKVLENKINSLNQLPLSVVTSRFLSSLNINFNELESSAWQQRNNAAHGKPIEEGGYIQLLKDIKVLKVIFHRVLLHIVNGSDYYFDYYSIGFPIRNIKDSIPIETK